MKNIAVNRDSNDTEPAIFDLSQEFRELRGVGVGPGEAVVKDCLRHGSCVRSMLTSQPMRNQTTTPRCS
jgi:hypothetical protein